MPITAIVDLNDDVVPYLNMTKVPADGGTKLQGIVDACQTIIEDMVGDVIQKTIGPEYYDGGDSTLILRRSPVISITTMTETIGLVNYTLTNQLVGSPVDNYGYTIDNPRFGHVTRRSAGSQPFRFFPNVGNIAVTYVVGLTSVPSNIRDATLELIRHRYQFGQQAFGPSSAFVPGVATADADEFSISPSGYLVPNRVAEMCQPSRRLPGMA